MSAGTARAGAGRASFGPSAAVVLLASLALLLAVAPSAQAAFPGQNGRIAFDRGSGPPPFDYNIHTAEPDGSGEVQITSGAARDVQPAWSPDGARIAFATDRGAPVPGFCCPFNVNTDVWVMNADGSGVTGLTIDPAGDRQPAWSPDGTRLAFTSTRGGQPEIWLMDADGSDQQLLTEGSEAAWSPDGTRIAFASARRHAPGPGHEIYTIHPDGTGLTRLTTVAGERCDPGGLGHATFTPDWSPSGHRIVYVRARDTGCPEEQDAAYFLETMNPDGTGIEGLTPETEFGLDRLGSWSPDGSRIVFERFGDFFQVDADGAGEVLVFGFGENPDWQPILRGYVRPKGATPTQVSLVPSFEPCSAPDMTHGPALVAPSCSSPTLRSSHLVVGQPVSDGGLGGIPAARMSLRMDVLVGNPATGTDEADVALTASLTDIRCRTPITTTCAAANVPGAPDYAGELEVRLTLRITDRQNIPYPGGAGAGTSSEVPLSFTIPCAATDNTIGAGCSVTTTADTVAGASTAKEGARAVWELGQVEVRDGGADGDGDTTADNSVFAVQGVFAP